MDDPRSGSEGSDSESLNPKTANIEPDVSKEPVPDDPFLSGAYQRIFRTAIVLSLLGTAAARFADRRSALGLAIGAAVGCISFAGLHQGAEMLVRRMLPESGKASKLWLLLSFPVRYFIVIAAAYVILRSYPGMRVGFMIGLVVPVIAMMCEAGYEALSAGKPKSQNSL